MKADFGVLDGPQGRILQPRGDWTVLQIGPSARELGEELQKSGQADSLDLAKLERVDMSGAYVLLRALKHPEAAGAGHPDFARLAQLVLPPKPADDHTPPPARHPAAARGQLFLLFESIGRSVSLMGAEAFSAMAFFGELVLALGRTIRHPHRLRLTPLFAVMEQAGIDAIPICMVMTFFIGAVIALVGANSLSELGVSIYTVELVDISILREFGVVIAAILLAGRSASAFAAEIGSMRMNQETDAMQVMGVDQFDALVVPRILAALLMLPLLTFCADIGGLVGGMAVSWGTQGINPVFFMQRTLEMVTLSEFWIGLCKAPFLAIIIAASGCRHGLLVGGDVASLGRAVTTAVVQSIFLIILFDAVFAVIFRVLDV